MPGPKTHHIFYKDLKDRLSADTLRRHPSYDTYSLFAQGHDLILFTDFYKIWNLKKNVKDSLVLQEGGFPEFVYNYLNEARKNESITEEMVRAFLIGYISHHILDSHVHPQLIYYTGGHTPNKNDKVWEHGIAETLIDSYFMKKNEQLDSKKYKVYRDFHFKEPVSADFLNTLSNSLTLTYNLPLLGQKFKIAFYQSEILIRILRYDPTGIKKSILDHADKLCMGASSMSYYVDYQKAEKYLNLDHNLWKNPYNENLTSNESMLELYEKALIECANIINELDKMMKSGTFNEKDINNLIPDVSSITGLKGNNPKTR